MLAPQHSFLQAGCSSWHPTNSVKTLKARSKVNNVKILKPAESKNCVLSFLQKLAHDEVSLMSTLVARWSRFCQPHTAGFNGWWSCHLHLTEASFCHSARRVVSEFAILSNFYVAIKREFGYSYSSLGKMPDLSVHGPCHVLKITPTLKYPTDWGFMSHSTQNRSFGKRSS